jgi:hypothetical protein
MLQEKRLTRLDERRMARPLTQTRGQHQQTSSYGRIDGPRVWIEFTVQEGTSGGMAGHYHTIWRDKAADYGADFVR